MKKKLIIVLAAIVALVAGYIGFLNYEQHKFMESIIPLVKNVSLRLANAARYETEKDTGITYKELFEKLESDVSEIDKRILEIQTIASPNNKEVTDPVLGYLNGSQKLIRALSLKYRNQLALNSAHYRTDSAIAALQSVIDNPSDFVLMEAKSAVKDNEETEAKYNEAKSGVLNAAIAMKVAYAKAIISMPSDALAAPAFFEEVIQNNEVKQMENQRPADQTVEAVLQQNKLARKGNGTVLSSTDTENYTYIELTENGKTRWIATPTVSVKKGDIVRFSDGSVMANFFSKPMNRAFESLVFVDKVQVAKK